MRNALTPLADDPLSYWENRLLSKVGVNWNVIGPVHRRRFRGHSTAAQIRRHLPAKVYDGLFKFAFVRNPWDRLVSLYYFIQQRPAHRHQRRVAAMTFAEFADEWTRRHDALQKGWVCDGRGKMIVDFVGRMETLEDDFGHIREHLGAAADLQVLNSSGQRRDFRAEYTDEIRDLVADRLAEDIEFFGYQFALQPTTDEAEASRDCNP